MRIGEAHCQKPTNGKVVQNMDSDMQELADHVAEQMKRFNNLEFTVKKQGHLVSTLGKSFENLQTQVEGNIRQMASMTVNLSTLVNLVAETGKKLEIKEGKQTEGGIRSGKRCCIPRFLVDLGRVG
ncbi:hypothetical protein M9H77_07410 [Catharanthus roseus]|uniref:Uncharacterized protein n=1 Tax=Catharanthus roseus TaxID=4058 RepID=A0ACC0BUU6_CATRO|nr:hypothetical protein M9H77_07410 [Catharanthus roseus]